MATVSGKLPTFKYFTHPSLDKPYCFITGVSQEIFDEAMSFKAKPGDVFVMTYPKCGTTFTSRVLQLMRSVEAPQEEMVPFLEMEGTKEAENITLRPRIMKTHFYFDMTPWHPEAKYIAVARNPKDCFVSFFHHTVGFIQYNFSGGKFEDYFELILNGEVDSGDYFKCAGEWFEKSKTNSNILFLLYEDMLENTERELLKMADFIGGGWGEKLRANDNELLKKVVELSSFKSMKTMERQLCGDSRPADNPFFRKGVIGDWKNHFTKEQSDRVDEKMKEAGRKYPGFDRLWDKYDDVLSF